MTLPSKNRIESLDLLKGLVMLIMAIDHVRDYFHYPSFFFDPTDPARTSMAIFVTRFMTNFCAPAFSFLAGISAFMVGRKKSVNELSAFLLKRGLWLIFMEVVVMNFGWHFNFHFESFQFTVIWSLGISMIFLAGLVYLPREVILIFSCIMIFGHNLLDPVKFDGSLLWTFLHERKRYADILPGHTIGVSYPIIPWVAVMSLGYCFGLYYDKTFDGQKRRQIFNLLGVAALVLFFVLRSINSYGDLLPWSDYGAPLRTFYSFFNLSKYPPSLMFLLVTLGGTLIFLANTERLSTEGSGMKAKIVSFFCLFGRVPFFYYILHIYFIHLAALIIAGVTGFGWQKMILPALPFRVPALKGFGYNLITVYAIWITLIIVLYPLCKAFDNYKQRHKEKWWLSYL